VPTEVKAYRAWPYFPPVVITRENMWMPHRKLRSCTEQPAPCLPSTFMLPSSILSYFTLHLCVSWSCCWRLSLLTECLGDGRGKEGEGSVTAEGRCGGVWSTGYLSLTHCRVMENLKWRRYVGNLDIDGKIMLEWALGNWVWGCTLVLSGVGNGPLAGCCEYSNKLQGSKKNS
jgi:hypothetical protein